VREEVGRAVAAQLHRVDHGATAASATPEGPRPSPLRSDTRAQGSRLGQKTHLGRGPQARPAPPRRTAASPPAAQPRPLAPAASPLAARGCDSSRPAGSGRGRRT
jgi:hypothetical protein